MDSRQKKYTKRENYALTDYLLDNFVKNTYYFDVKIRNNWD